MTSEYIGVQETGRWLMENWEVLAAMGLAIVTIGKVIEMRRKGKKNQRPKVRGSKYKKNINVPRSQGRR